MIARGGEQTFFADVEGYIKTNSPFLLENGFFETELSRETDRFGNIAQIFSTYEARMKEDDETPFLRGLNSFQLLYEKDRWWVVTIMWQHETPDNPIPAEYLD